MAKVGYYFSDVHFLHLLIYRITDAVARLFQLKRYPELKTDLSALNETVRLALAVVVV